MSGTSSPNLLSHFRFGQTCSETKTLQIVLESFCANSPAYDSFYFSQGGSFCFPFFTSLEPAFLHCGVHPFLSMFLLRTLFPGHLSFHSALSSYGLCPARSLANLCLSTMSVVQALASCPASGAPWSSAMPPHPSEGVG